MEELFFLCPHCDTPIIVYKKDLNCHIFRHGIFKHSYKQIDPHLKKEICDELFQKELIYGCGKPFKIININNEYKIEKCDYI